MSDAPQDRNQTHPVERTPNPPRPEDSATFSRCAECAHSDRVDVSGGTLLCKKHDMYINAEADEIPDDCVEFEAKG